LRPQLKSSGRCVTAYEWQFKFLPTRSHASTAKRTKPLSREPRNKLWINPLLSQLKLVRKTEEYTDPNISWKQLEATGLPEQIGRIASEINEAAGYHLLETFYFLPPQKNALSVRFDRNRSKHIMEIVIRDTGISVRFSTLRRFSFGLERYFSGDRLSNGSTLVWEQRIRPEEILEEHIQGWLTYLLSEFSKEFRPDLISTPLTQADISVILRKASA